MIMVRKGRRYIGSWSAYIHCGLGYLGFESTVLMAADPLLSFGCFIQVPASCMLVAGYCTGLRQVGSSLVTSLEGHTHIKFTLFRSSCSFVNHC